MVKMNTYKEIQDPGSSGLTQVRSFQVCCIAVIILPLTTVSYAQITAITIEAENASLIGTDFNEVT
jgi:hypothetical protein